MGERRERERERGARSHAAVDDGENGSGGGTVQMCKRGKGSREAGTKETYRGDQGQCVTPNKSDAHSIRGGYGIRWSMTTIDESINRYFE